MVLIIENKMYFIKRINKYQKTRVNVVKYALFWTNKSLFTTLLQWIIWNERKIKNAVKSVIIYHNE